jgi:putative transposase
MALDLHQRPYYGKKNTKGCTQRQKKASTRKSFTYATLAVLDRSGRFTVGLVPTRPTMRLSTVVGRLLSQAAEAGLSIAYLMLDKEFYAAEVIALLQQHRVPFLMPARRKGSKPAAGNQHLFAATTAVGWYDYTWTTRLRRLDAKKKQRRKAQELTVQVRMCVARHQANGKPLVYASWGLGAGWSAAQIVQAYRKRFGIEVKYRQLGVCLARTSSRCERYRLLLIGVALLLCNLWAWLHSELFSCGPLGERRLHLGRLRLAELIAAIAAVAANLLGGYIDEWPIQRPLPSCFTAEPA